MSIQARRVPLENTQYLHLSAALLVTVARWWCDVPEEDLEALKKLAADFKPKRRVNEMTPGNRKMVRQFDDHALALRLLTLSKEIHEPFLRRKGFTLKEARRIQRATMVEVQLSTALRTRNLASLKIGKHLLERGGKLYIHVPAEEVKNQVQLDFELSEHCAKTLRFYISKVRPLLCDGDNQHLWPSKNGKALSTNHVGSMLGDFMEDEVGVRVTAHRFRHVVGYLYLLDFPGGYEIVRLLLGHKSIETTTKFYASLEAKEGHKRYDAFIERRRNELIGNKKRHHD